MSNPNESSASGKRRSKIRRLLAVFGVNSLLLSILVHVFFGVVATYLIVEHFQKKHINFQAPAAPASNNEVEHKVQLEKKNNVASAPPDLKRIVTTAVSTITLPDVPETPAPDEVTPTTLSGVDGVMGSGPGGGNGNGNGGGLPEFGSANGTGLEGYFYDLKQTPERRPTGINRKNVGAYYSALTRFIDHGWNDAILDKYFKSETPLFTDRFAISTRQSEEAPKAFHVEKEVEPSLWAVHYRGKVTAPDSGNYQFIGFADNVLVVRIAGKTVLDAGYTPLLSKPDLHIDLHFEWSKLYGEQLHAGPRGEFKKGTIFHVEKGQVVDMDVLIGDDGGYCAFFLLCMKVGNNYVTESNGTLQVPFFQMNNTDAPTFTSQEEHPPYSTTPEPWPNGDY